MKVSAKKGTITAADFRKAVRILQKADLYYIPVMAGEAKWLRETFDDHLCSRPPAKCKVCKVRKWFAETWGKRIRVLTI